MGTPTGSVRSALEVEYSLLKRGLRLPDSALRPDAPAFLKHFDMAFARQVLANSEPWGCEDAFAEGSRLEREVLLASTESRQLYLAAECDLLRQVKENGNDQIHRGPFDLMEAIFPVRVNGCVLHVLRSGKYRTKPFSASDLKELAFLAAVPLKDTEAAAAAVPVLDEAAAERVRALYGHWRDSAELALRERVQSLTLAAQQIQCDRLYALGTLADGMAHRVSNLLATILGYTSLVLDKAELPAEHVEALRKAAEAAQRGRRFTEEVFTVAAAQEAEDDQPGSVHECLEGVIALLSSRIGTDVTVTTDFQATNDRVMAPPGLLHQMAVGLLVNALDSMPGGGRLRVTTNSLPSEEDQVPRLRIVVADSAGIDPRGEGKAEAKRPAIDTLSGEEIAPRLTSLWGLVGRLEGTVTLRTDPGHTTEVDVVLPVTTADRAAAPQRMVRRRLAPSRIWVVDDDPLVREMCRRVLEEEGHSVQEIASGDEAIARCGGEEQHPDLLVCDFNLPDRSGLEICTWLREAGHRTPVVLVSGLTVEHPQVVKVLKLRKTFYLRKPFTFRDLADTVTIAMGETLVGESAVH